MSHLYASTSYDLPNWVMPAVSLALTVGVLLWKGGKWVERMESWMANHEKLDDKRFGDINENLGKIERHVKRGA